MADDENREERIFARAELVSMLVFFVIGVAIIIVSLQMRLTNALGVGPGMFPFFSGLLLGGLGLAGSIVQLRRFMTSAAHPAPPAAEPAVPTPESEYVAEEERFLSVKWYRLAIAIVFLVAFVLVVPYLGFTLSLALLTFGLMTLVAGRGWLLSLIVTVVTAAVIYFGFGVFLNIHLPAATLPFLSWLNI